jgi:hypothetical protein
LTNFGKIFFEKAIEKAKESYRKERLLAKQREEKNLMEQNNPELTGFVSFELNTFRNQ